MPCACSRNLNMPREYPGTAERHRAAVIGLAAGTTVE
jgi:hypothetical protein